MLNFLISCIDKHSLLEKDNKMQKTEKKVIKMNINNLNKEKVYIIFTRNV